jgi:hypothetical protein
MLSTHLHQKEYVDASYEVARLYEHLVIFSFYKHLESKQIQSELIGRVSGETFDSIIFLNANFYDPKIAYLYEEFLRSPLVIDEQLALRSLRKLEVEDKVKLIARDVSVLNQQLRALISTPWTENTSALTHALDNPKLPTSPIEIKKASKDFRNILIGVYAENNELDQDEQVLMLRLSAVIGDIIHFELREQLDCYYLEGSPIMKDEGIIGNTYTYRFNKKVLIKTIEETIETKLQAFDVPSAMPLIELQFNEFASRQSWNNEAVDFCRNTGFVTSNEHIASLATLERVTSVVSKLKIHVKTV